MKKYWYVVILAVVLVLSYGSNMTSFWPNFVNTGKVFTTIMAENVGGTVVLIAVETNQPAKYDSDNRKIFFILLSQCHGYPPSTFTVWPWGVYPLSWANRWGYQAEY